jgi:serine protease AprX
MQMGVSWDDSKKPSLTVALIAGLLAAALVAGPLVTAKADAFPASAPKRVEVIIRRAPGSGHTAELAVRAAGGIIERRLDIVNGFVARLPRSAVHDLRASGSVLSVTPDARVRMQHYVDGYDPTTAYGSMARMAYLVGAYDLYPTGITGNGVDVALIDTGVVPVEGLSAPGKVVNGPDLSFESQDPALRHLDTYGHGTHMAGIIAGRDSALTDAELPYQHDKFAGIAPGARIVSVKVGDAEGATDVSQVIAAIDWVVKHRRDDGLNIRVLNLSFGTDGVQSYVLDPLSYAADVAWRKGIVVVVAAGNRGFGTKALNNPATNPRTIAVGSMDYQGSFGYGDDQVSDFSSVGTIARRVDLLAPGRSVISLRSPGSMADVEHPAGRVGFRFFKGSGTSQSAAVVSGAAALLLDQRPSLTPNQVKKLLVSSAKPLPNASTLGQGAGALDVSRAARMMTPSSLEASQTFTLATGLGSLDGARGTNRLASNGVELNGEQDIFGNPWNAASWASAALNEVSWIGGAFNGFAWTGDAWNGTSFAVSTWGSITWTKNSWSGESWTKNSWSKNSWSSDGWTGDGWVKNSWSGGDWAKNSWSSYEFDKNSWSSAGWN